MNWAGGRTACRVYRGRVDEGEEYAARSAGGAFHPGFHDPYEEVQIRGRVVERRPDSDFKMMDPISHKYTGKPFPFRSPEGRVALVIEVEKVRYTKLPFEHTPAI